MVRLNAIDWAARRQEHREEEWKTRTELLELARSPPDAGIVGRPLARFGSALA